MAKYYVNNTPQSTGEHEIHKTGCQWMPSSGNRTELGDFASCVPAVAAARKVYANVDGCATCCPACHTK